MKKIKAYPTYQGSLDAERHRERQWRKTKQGAFESSFVSFEEAKEGFYPLGAVVSRAYHHDPEKAKRNYSKAYKHVVRHAPHCLEVFKLILKNGKNRQKSICEMTNTLIEKKCVLKKALPANESSRRKSGSTSSIGVCL